MANRARGGELFACGECGANSPKWLGRCPGCGGWNTLAAVSAARRRAGADPSSHGTVQVQRLGDVRPDEARRLVTGIGELDRVLGGGFVAGGVTLLGGDPGIGKSTLVMQALAALAARGERGLYLTGEESASQVALRATRLGGPSMGDVGIVATTDLEEAEAALAQTAPGFVVVDSIQTLRSASAEPAAGTVVQLREVTARLTELAKRKGIAMVLVGHVTKDGALAGPRVLEHLVDAVLSFEGERGHAFRVLRASKNRFGTAEEVGVFEMLQDGLREVRDPSGVFLGERPVGVAGSVVAAVSEGNRSVLMEVQSLVAPASYGSARRVVSGLDANRLAILLAVLERKCGAHVLDLDVFASLAGGARSEDRGLDLALAIAVVSSVRERAASSRLCVFGEVGLAGEIRGVTRPEARVVAACRLGFTHVVLPEANRDAGRAVAGGLELAGVRSLSDALDAVFSVR